MKGQKVRNRTQVKIDTLDCERINTPFLLDDAIVILADLESLNDLDLIDNSLFRKLTKRAIKFLNEIQDIIQETIHG